MQDTTKQNTIKQDGHANQENWRIDEEILPTSQWRLLIVAFWLFLMLLVMGVSGLVWWQWLIMLVVTGLGTWYYRHNHISQRFPVAHITQPPLDKLHRSPWFVYVDTKQDKLQLWQGYLNAMYVNRYLVILHFDIVEPLPNNRSVTIWRDQVSEEGWRKLQVFGRL